MQEKICREAAAADGSGKEFILDKWDRGEGGKYVCDSAACFCFKVFLAPSPSPSGVAVHGAEEAPALRG